MKQLCLSLLLLQGVTEVHAELTAGQKTAVAASAAGVSFLWFWNREPNSAKIIRAHNLYKNCQSCVGRQQAYVVGNPELSLQQLRSCSIMQQASEITACCKDVKGRNAWFWNKTRDLSDAVSMMSRLEQSLKEYQSVEHQLEQEIVIHQIDQLWSQLSKYVFDQNTYQIIKYDTLRELLSHQIIKYHNTIAALKTSLQYNDDALQLFGYKLQQAYKRIDTLSSCLSVLQKVVAKIERYEALTNKYQQLLMVYYSPVVDKQDLVIHARSLGNGAYPLIHVVSVMQEDMQAVKNISLEFRYVKNIELPILSYDAKKIVLQALDYFIKVVINSSAYRDEKRRQEEQRMHEERMRLEQQRLCIERERLRLEQDRAAAERARVRAEKEKADVLKTRTKIEEKKLQAELDAAYANGAKQKTSNDLQAELDRAYESESYTDHNSWW